MTDAEKKLEEIIKLVKQTYDLFAEGKRPGYEHINWFWAQINKLLEVK